jgi:hypothetical protein
MRVRLGIVSAVATVAVAGLVGVTPAAAAPLARPSDPVVLTGSALPKFVNGPKARIVGFRWTGSAWVQLPIQVDERAVVNFGKIYNNPTGTYYNSKPGAMSALVYTSPNTWTGADPNPKFDADDELVFMARDAGVQAPEGSNPPGTKPGTGEAIRVTDPVAPGAEGYVYLFAKTAGSKLQQGARAHYVKYSFKLKAGGYKTKYLINSGPNAENSLATGATYRHHFSDRWLSDQLMVTAPGASGVDILDRHKALFAPGSCVRSEDTFDIPSPLGSSEGAFVTSKVGAVRAIRSYVGANSGPNTQRTHFFYDRREDIVTNLRVHPIPSIMDFFDYSPAATGMTYRNDLNPVGVTIDGNPDVLRSGTPSWEQVTGPQGTVDIVGSVAATGFTPSATNYYLDDSTPATTQCTGDAFAYGSSGLLLTGGGSDFPNTDPATGATASLTGTRIMYFEGPGGTAISAAAHRADALSPLTTAVSAVP